MHRPRIQHALRTVTLVAVGFLLGCSATPSSTGQSTGLTSGDASDSSEDGGHSGAVPNEVVCVTDEDCAGQLGTLTDCHIAVCDDTTLTCVQADCATQLGTLPECILAACDVDTQTCVEEDALSGTICDDGSVCTIADVCLAGNCLPGGPRDCEDTNPCTDEGCDAETGCAHVFNTIPCDDDDACTVDDVCHEGSCSSGEAAGCDDEVPCTIDSCDALVGCINIPDPGAACDDGDACTTQDQCDPTGLCQSQTSLDCDDGNACTIDSCSTIAGCVHDNSTAPCDDGDDDCTLDDACVEGSCIGSPNTCDDEDLCTFDSCLPGSGCVHDNNEGPCNDENPCTNNDSCVGGTCVGVETVCEDSNECTFDYCHLIEGCQVSPLEGAQCDDGDACSSFDTCTGEGTCVAIAPTYCDDDNPCTSDSCDTATGCIHTPVDVTCDDVDACTEDDHCVDGACSGTSITCDDGNPCTNDECSAAFGCTYPFSTGFCDDGDACTVNDLCLSGACLGLSNSCDDGKSCTVDSCDPATALCHHVNLVGSCDDGDACTVDDACVGSECISGPSADCDDDDACTIDLCDVEQGCSHTTVPSCLPPAAWPIINEFDYEQSGDDQSDFVELFVVGEQTVELDIYTLELVDGSTGQAYAVLQLSDAAEQLHPGERLLIGPAAIIDPVVGTVATLVTAGDFLDNGGQDGGAIRVMRASPNGPVVVDTVAYEYPVAGANEGDTHVGFDGQFGDELTSFARCPDGLDTNVNSFDFALGAPSPGVVNECLDGTE